MAPAPAGAVLRLLIDAERARCTHQSKHRLIRAGMRDNIVTHFCASFIAGFVATVVTSPFDVIKTRYMNAASGRYRSIVDCAASTWREGGLRIFYSGFTPAYIRLGPHTVLTFVFLEKIKRYLGGPT